MEDSITRLREIAAIEQIPISEEAMHDAITLCDGDMRKIVNMLQSINISLKADAIDPNYIVDRNFIYKMTGYPHPKDIDEIFEILMNDSVKDAYAKIKKMKAAKGISLIGIVTQISQKVLELEGAGNIIGNIIMRLGEIEYRLSISCSEDIQLGSLVSAFTESRIKSL
jgi:replication factor C subunit 3/5